MNPSPSKGGSAHTWQRPLIFAALAFVVAIATACSSFGAKDADEPGLEEVEAARIEQTEQAIASVQRMSQFLATLPALRFQADVQYDTVQQSGEKIEFGSHRRMAMRRPDRARIEATHWDGEVELMTFDGERLSVAIPERQIFASVATSGRSRTPSNS